MSGVFFRQQSTCVERQLRLGTLCIVRFVDQLAHAFHPQFVRESVPACCCTSRSSSSADGGTGHGEAVDGGHADDDGVVGKMAASLVEVEPSFLAVHPKTVCCSRRTHCCWCSCWDWGPG